MTTATPGKRRFLRFSLRTLVVLMLIICVALGWKVQQARNQRETVAWILQSGGSFYYDHQLYDDGDAVPNPQPPGPKWLTELLGVDYLDSVVEVSLSETEVVDVATLAVLTNVEGLSLWYSQVSDVSPLADLARLERLVLSGSPVTDLTPLGGLTNLKRLFLSSTPVTDLTPLGGLTNLEHLDLQDTQVRDVRTLARLKSLRYLFLGDTPVSKEDYEMLKKALPNCDISWSPAAGDGT